MTILDLDARGRPYAYEIDDFTPPPDGVLVQDDYLVSYAFILKYARFHADRQAVLNEENK